jgi:hypothetical protein
MMITKSTFSSCNVPGFNWVNTHGFIAHNFESFVHKGNNENFNW